MTSKPACGCQGVHVRVCGHAGLTPPCRAHAPTCPRLCSHPMRGHAQADPPHLAPHTRAPRLQGGPTPSGPQRVTWSVSETSPSQSGPCPAPPGPRAPEVVLLVSDWPGLPSGPPPILGLRGCGQVRGVLRPPDAQSPASGMGEAADPARLEREGAGRTRKTKRGMGDSAWLRVQGRETVSWMGCHWEGSGCRGVVRRAGCGGGRGRRGRACGRWRPR